MKPIKRTLPSLLADDAPINAATAPALAAVLPKPGKGPQHSFFIDEDLEPALRRAMYNKGINKETGKRYTKQDIFNLALRAFAGSDPDAQRPMPGVE